MRQPPADDASAFLTDVLPEIMDILNRSDVQELELQSANMKLRLHRTWDGFATDPTDSDDETSSLVTTERYSIPITSPLVGTFYRASTVGMPPLVSAGTRVQEDTVVGIVEALSVLTEVEAGCTGVVTNVLATDGQTVEYGQVLFEVDGID